MPQSSFLTQRGATLITSLLLMLLMSLLGLATVNSSVLHLQISRNAQSAQLQQNTLEATLAIAKHRITHHPLNDDDYLDLTLANSQLFQPEQTTTWPSTATHPGPTDESDYLIEYLGCYLPQATATLRCPPTPTANELHLYKLTARMTHSNGAQRYAQRTLTLAYPPDAPRPN